MTEQHIDIKDLELNALLEITQAVNNNLPEEDLYRIYKFTMLADLKIRKLALYVKDEDWVSKASFGVEGNGPESLPRHYTGLNQIEEVDSDDPYYTQFDQVLPVSHKDRLLAVVFIGGILDNDMASNSTFLRALTNIIMVAIENKKMARRELRREAYKKEMEIAKKVQNFLFPKELPRTENLSIDAVYLPHDEVGGDYYDYIELGFKKFLICIADVSGKGVPAALLMSNFQASLRTLTRKTHDVQEIVQELNSITCISGNQEHFITFFIAVHDGNSEEFRYVNCGHNPLYLRTPTELHELNNGTTILGIFDPLPFIYPQVIKGLSEFFFFGYTDGLTETFNEEDEQFGEERLRDFFQRGTPGNINELHRQVFMALDTFRGDVSYKDDITMLSCHYTA